MRSEAIAAVHTTVGRRDARATGTTSRWPGTIVVPSSPFGAAASRRPPADLPRSAAAAIDHSVSPADDRVVLRPRPGTRVPREDGPDEHGDEDDDDDTTEHVFAL